MPQGCLSEQLHGVGVDLLADAGESIASALFLDIALTMILSVVSLILWKLFVEMQRRGAGRMKMTPYLFASLPAHRLEEMLETHAIAP